MSGPTMVRAAVATPSALVRAGLAAGLGDHGIEVVQSAATLAELRAAGFAGADVAIVDVADEADGDLALPHGDGPPFILLVDPADERLGEWLIDGAAVLARGASPRTVAGAVQAVLSGLVATTASLAAEALRFERVGERRPALPGADMLTRREREVLVAMSHGLGNREIGSALGISAHTAKFHVAQIIAKLQAQSRGHAVAKALRAGLVDA